MGDNLHQKSSEDAGPPKRYYFENLKISLPQVKLSVFTSHKLPPDLKVVPRLSDELKALTWVNAWKLKPEQVFLLLERA